MAKSPVRQVHVLLSNANLRHETPPTRRNEPSPPGDICVSRAGEATQRSIALINKLRADSGQGAPRVPAVFYLLRAAFEALAAAACARSFSAHAVNAASIASLRVMPWPAAIILMFRFSLSERRT